MNYTKELYDKLTKYRDKLYTACQLDYVRLTSIEEKKALNDLYELAFNSKSGIMNGCSRCLLRDTKRLGVAYFADEKEYKELELKTQSVDNQPNKITKKKKATNNVTKQDKTINS